MKTVAIIHFVDCNGASKCAVEAFSLCVYLRHTYWGLPNGSAEEDLRRTVADINSMNDIAFVVLTGDITELERMQKLN